MLSFSAMRSRLRPWTARVGRGCGGQCTLSPVGPGGAFDVVVSWQERQPDGTRTPHEYRRAVTEQDLKDKPCAIARSVLRYVLKLRGLE